MSADAVKRCVGAEPERVKGMAVPPFNALSDLLKPDAADKADGVGEILVDDVLSYADSLEYLRRLVRLNGRNAHFGGYLHDSVKNGGIVVVYSCGRVFVKHSAVDKLFYALLCKVRIDRPCAVAEKRGKLMHVARLSAFKDKRDRGALLCPDKILLHCRNGKE